MLRKLHFANAQGRDATVVFQAVTVPVSVRMGIPGAPVKFRRWIVATESTLHDQLSSKLGPSYGKALVDGDPEVDIEQVGREVGHTSNVYLSSTGQVLYAAPQVMELVLAPDGTEKERRTPVDTVANVNDTMPLRWAGVRLKRAEAARKFVFSRTLQLKHVDGLTYDYLFAMAKELDEKDEVVLVGAGEKGRDPLVFQSNATPWRAFLEGRVDGQKYQLLLHLSNLELKMPPRESQA